MSWAVSQSKADSSGCKRGAFVTFVLHFKGSGLYIINYIRSKEDVCRIPDSRTPRVA